jgi:hypothetical protein
VGGTEEVSGRDGTIVGITLGFADNEQLWQPEADADRVTGPIAGLYADVATGLSWLRVGAEGSYTQRNGDVVLDQGGQETTGGVRAHLLAVGVHLALVRRVGRVRLHALAGPTLDQVLSARLDPVLSQVLEEESTVVFGLSVGGGVGVWLSDTLFLAADVRLTENLGDAYSGNFTSFRNRSLEYRVLAGVPIAWIRER